MDDNSIMPFGKYQGEKLANVPAYYLLMALEKQWLHGELKKYVEDNFQDLTMEKERNG